MNELKVFNFNDNEVRTVLINNEPYFVLTDVCKVLEIKNATDVAKRLDDDEVTRFNLGGLSGESNVINESGLYTVILRSDKPQAKSFRKWVTSEVLPSIRKTGGYHLPKTYREALLELVAKEEQNEKLMLENKQQEQIISELKPKADYTDTILKSKSLMTITQIAKDYGMSGQKMNRILKDLGVQYFQSGQWLLYSKYQSHGYTSSETIHFKRKDGKDDTKLDTKWTQKGRLFLYNLLKDKCILPTIERDDI